MHFLSVLVPTFLAIISMFALPCLQWVFQDEGVDRNSYSTKTVDIIKHLMNHEPDDVNAALESMANISEAMTLLQNLELEREEKGGATNSLWPAYKSGREWTKHSSG